MKHHLIIIGMITLWVIVGISEVFASPTHPRPQFDGERAGPFSAALFFAAVGIMITCFVLMVKYRNTHPTRIKYLVVFAGLSLILAATIISLTYRPV